MSFFYAKSKNLLLATLSFNTEKPVLKSDRNSRRKLQAFVLSIKFKASFAVLWMPIYALLSIKEWHNFPDNVHSTFETLEYIIALFATFVFIFATCSYQSPESIPMFCNRQPGPWNQSLNPYQLNGLESRFCVHDLGNNTGGKMKNGYTHDLRRQLWNFNTSIWQLNHSISL